MLCLGPGCGPKPKPKINSEFNSIHFGVEINKSLKFLRAKKFLGPKICDKFENSY